MSAPEYAGGKLREQLAYHSSSEMTVKLHVLVIVYNTSSAGNRHFCDLVVRVKEVITIEKT